MILSRGRAYVFVHIPKTGGTSLATALETRAMRDDILVGDTPKAKKRRRRLAGLPARGRLWKHATLRDIDGLVTPNDLREMFVFTMVRNPWDRLVSYYRWLRTQSFDHAAVHHSKRLDFGAFLREPAIAESLRRAPASSYVTDVTGVERCALYIRLEHFHTDAAPLFDHLGFRFSLPHLNVSDRSDDYRIYYDEETRALVENICEADIVRFGYRF